MRHERWGHGARHHAAGPHAAHGRRLRVAALAVAGIAAVAITGCGGGGSTSTSSPPGEATVAVVRPPAFTLSGCTYVLDNTIPPGEPQGVKPSFPAFAPDAAAVAAEHHIGAHGGTAMVDSVTIPAGTSLYAGPDTGTPVGTVASADAILAAEPVVWTDASGGTWLAFYLSCGGDALYWVSLDEMKHQNPSAESTIAQQIAQLRAAPSYTSSGTASMLAVTVDSHHHLVFTAPKVTFVVGRGELFSG